MFSANNPLKVKAKIFLKILYPGDEVFFTIKGRVKRISNSSGASYKYMIAVQFDPFGEKKWQNDPSCLEKIKNLEGLFFKEAKYGKKIWFSSAGEKVLREGEQKRST